MFGAALEERRGSSRHQAGAPRRSADSPRPESSGGDPKWRVLVARGTPLHKRGGACTKVDKFRSRSAPGRAAGLREDSARAESPPDSVRPESSASGSGRTGKARPWVTPSLSLPPRATVATAGSRPCWTVQQPAAGSRLARSDGNRTRGKPFRTCGKSAATTTTRESPIPEALIPEARGFAALAHLARAPRAPWPFPPCAYGRCAGRVS